MFGENAVITALYGPATTDGYGDTQGTGTLLWAGHATCVLRRGKRRNKTGDTSTNQNRDEAIVRLTTGFPSSLTQPGDQATATRVVITDQRAYPAVQRSYRILDTDTRAGALSVDSCRLMLEDDR